MTKRKTGELASPDDTWPRYRMTTRATHQRYLERLARLHAAGVSPFVAGYAASKGEVATSASIAEAERMAGAPVSATRPLRAIAAEGQAF